MTAPLVHLVRPASTNQRPSLLVLLHGVGSHEGDLFALAEAVRARDDRLPLRHGRESQETLRSLGVEPNCCEFAMGHTITGESLAFVSDGTARIPGHS